MSVRGIRESLTLNSSRFGVKVPRTGCQYVANIMLERAVESVCKIGHWNDRRHKRQSRLNKNYHFGGGGNNYNFLKMFIWDDSDARMKKSIKNQPQWKKLIFSGFPRFLQIHNKHNILLMKKMSSSFHFWLNSSFYRVLDVFMDILKQKKFSEKSLKNCFLGWDRKMHTRAIYSILSLVSPNFFQF